MIDQSFFVVAHAVHSIPWVNPHRSWSVSEGMLATPV